MSEQLLHIIAMLIPAFPLAGFLINGLWASRFKQSTIPGYIASFAILASFILSITVFLFVKDNSTHVVTIAQWVHSGSFHFDFAFILDPLSALLLLIITGVGFLIHVYSIGYMHHDEGYARYFSYLNLFVFFMMLLVMGSNLLIMFMGWEGVGLASYLLIGFWFKNADYNLAARKAFIMNRIGDVGFVLGMFMILYHFGTLDFLTIEKSAAFQSTDSSIVVGITLLLFLAATGKSAQIPLYTWLPDAMAGPTPVSALIHAATMVTAGVYMIVRTGLTFAAAPATLTVILIIGIATSLLAALIALRQNDIKKVLAYSTVSQLGLMMAAVGLGAFSSALFHLTTHAFFKALLFLGAGSVIHGLSGVQDIRKMGGLKSLMPQTFATFLIATIAISGIPPFSGFFSKDEILAKAFEYSPWIWGLLQMSSLLTVFYMFRLVFLTFYGNFRGGDELAKHIHESPANMTMPLWILAGLSIIAGVINIPHVLGGTQWLHHYLEPVTKAAYSRLPFHVTLSHATEWLLMAIAVISALAVIAFAYRVFVLKGVLPPAHDEAYTGVNKLLNKKFWIDEVYATCIEKPLFQLSKGVYDTLEKGIIDGLVNNSGRLAIWVGNSLRVLQTGSIGFYIFGLTVGTIVLLIVALLWA